MHRLLTILVCGLYGRAGVTGCPMLELAKLGSCQLCTNRKMTI
jgi:hypothetical protein